MIQAGEFLTDITDLDNFVNFPFKALQPYLKELKNISTQNLNDDILADVGLNMIGRKIKKGISSIKGLGVTPTNNEIKEIIKVIKSLENR